MMRAAMASRRDGLGTDDQSQLAMATQAYFEALPLLHKTLIVELSEQREENPIAVLGLAIADGLERLVLEVTSTPSSE